MNSPTNCGYEMHGGLYDPVLDDSDVIFEPLDQDDFDQPSRPTEVDLPDFIDSLDILNGIPAILDKESESRSITASPLVCPTKPFRPFSVTPLPEVPPVEDPIILNPEYEDIFDTLVIDEDFLPKTRFKLPISEQYDPDGLKKKNNVEVGVKIEEIRDESREENKKTTTEFREFLSSQEVQSIEESRKEINREQIEKTASSIVEESIEKAVTVAEDIIREVDVALHDSSVISSSETTDSKQYSATKELVEEKSIAVDLSDKQSDVAIQESNIDIKVAKEKFESIDKQQEKLSVRKTSTKQEIEETIQAGTVKTKASIYDKVTDTKATQKVENKKKSTEQSTTKDSKAKGTTSNQNQKDFKENVTKTKTTKSSVKSGGTKTKTGTKSSTKSAQERAYVIGLQTIPNIKGNINSNYHYDMLLKTFFIHLTDVMVALSRFILTDPAHFKIYEEIGKAQGEKQQDEDREEEEEQEQEEEEEEIREEILTETVQEETVYKDTSEVRSQSDVQEDRSEKIMDTQSVKETLAKTIKDQRVKYTEDVQEVIATTSEEVHEKHHLSGSEMAQMSDNKSEELITKLGAVINEFQNKTGLEETEVVVGERRSRSRSRSRTKEIVRQVEPSVLATTVIEAANKVSKTEDIQEISELRTSKQLSSTFESQDKKTVESKYEFTESDVQSKDAKTYVAIVEAHVYTNKDAILNEQLTEFKQESSVQSAEKTNIALISNEAASTEKVALKDLEINREVAKSAIVSTQDLSTVSSESKVQVLQKSETANKIDDQKVFLDKTSMIAESGTVIEQKQEPVYEKLVKPVQKARVVKGILKAAKQEIKAEALSEVSKISTESLNKKVLQEISEVSATTEVKAEEIINQSMKAEIISQAVEEKIAQNESISRSKNSKIQESKVAVIETQNFEKSEQTNIVTESNQSEEISVNSFEAKTKTDEAAALKVTKEKVTGLQQVTKQIEDLRDIQKKIEINQKDVSIKSVESKTQFQESTVLENFVSEKVDQECSFIARSVDQESTFTIKTVETEKVDQHSTVKATEETVQKETKKLKLNTDIPLKKLDSQSSVASEIDTPTPATVPPTPLTDEYMFKLHIPLPPEPLVPIPRDCTPSDSDDEDPHIVKKNLVPHIETSVGESIIYDTPLQSPPATPGSPTKASPVYTKPGLRGGGDRRQIKNEEILEIERKSSLLASAIDQTIKSIEEYKEEVANKQENTERDIKANFNIVLKSLQEGMKLDENMPCETEKKQVDVQTSENVTNGFENNEIKRDVLEGFRPVQFHPEELQNARRELKSAMVSNGQVLQNQKVRQPYTTASGEIIGTHQGIVDGLEEAYVNEKLAKELGKPGMTEEKIAELISGESEMLREAHVMGLCRVLSTKMHRPDDGSSVDFKKIKPIVESLKDSEVLKALNEELMRTKEEKKKEERKWTTFMQKPQRPVPTVKFGYHGYTEPEVNVEEPYKVKIVKQPKPKVAPDYKPEVFETGLLPWEERALREPTPPPVEPEEPILVPEEQPEILEAIDPLPESEVPDLEDSGIPLPQPETEEDFNNLEEEEDGAVEIEELDLEAVVEETEKIVEESIVEEMEPGNVAEQLMMSVQNMVDPNAPLDQQLQQMRAQIAALAKLPCVIQQSLEMVTKQLSQLSQLESQIKNTTAENASEEIKEDSQEIQNQEVIQEQPEVAENVAEEAEEPQVIEVNTLTPEEIEKMRQEEEAMLEEQRRIEKQKKALMEQARLDHESRQLKTHPTPRVGKPKPVFGPPTPIERPLVLPGGRKWRKPQDAYNEQFIAETLAAQAEIIRGNAKGFSYESVLLPYDERINFMKYEKPPVSLDHLQESETYKLIHNMETQPQRRVDTLTPQVCEADYRELCRSITPCTERMAKEEHLDYPQQVQP